MFQFEDEFDPLKDEIFKDIFTNDGQMINSLPTYIIEHHLREVFNKLIERGSDIHWAFNGGKSRILYKLVSENFIREFWDYIIDWEHFWGRFKASEDFIREAPVKNWYNISKWQKLSEKFIWENKDRVDWDRICEYQILSKVFCYTHKEYMNWDAIIDYQDSYMLEKLPDEMIKKLYYT